MAIDPIFIAEAQYYARYHLQVEIIHGIKAEDADFGAREYGRFRVMASTKRIFRGDEYLKLGDNVIFPVYISEKAIYGGHSHLRASAFDTALYMEVFLYGEPPHCEPGVDCFYLIEELTAVPTVHMPYEPLPGELPPASDLIVRMPATKRLKQFPPKYGKMSPGEKLDIFHEFLKETD